MEGTVKQEARPVPGLDFTVVSLCEGGVTPQVQRTADALQEMVDLAHRELESRDAPQR